MKNFIAFIGLLCLFSFEAHSQKIYLLSNHSNAGDHNQVLGILTAFEKLSQENVPFEDLDTKTLTPLEIKNRIEQDLSHEKVIVIGAGEGGVNGLSELPKHSNLITCLTSHMFLEQYKNGDLLNKVNFIALPSHVSSEEKKELGSKLIETTGVAHNRHLDVETYDKWKKELPPADMYLGVYLGGDAPTPTNEINLFTEEDASRLADFVIGKAKELNESGLITCILVLNGPRTGKFDTEKKEIMTVHREGKADRITESFEKKLADKGIKYKIFDFQHNTPENKKWVAAYNAFDLVMGAVGATKGKMIVPGESTSVISEAIDVMAPGQVIIYNNSAMNNVHKAHVVSEMSAARACVLDNYKDIKTPGSHIAQIKPNATKVIAQRLLEASAETPDSGDSI